MTLAVRIATQDDIPAEHGIFCRAEGGLMMRHGFSWVDPPLAWFVPLAAHLLATDPARSFVAEEDGRVVGFSAAFVRDGVWFLAALFIDPDRQAQGLGRRLFDLAIDGAPSRRITITDAIQPVSNALYARHGLVPTTPVLLFEGTPAMESPIGLEADRPRPGDLEALDQAGYGFDRAVDHGLWSRQRRCTVWRRDDVAVAYAYRAVTGSMGPIVGLDPRGAADALTAELARARRASVLVPGSSRRLVDVALRAGLRLVGPPGNLLLSAEVRPPDRIAIANYFLY